MHELGQLTGRQLLQMFIPPRQPAIEPEILGAIVYLCLISPIADNPLRDRANSCNGSQLEGTDTQLSDDCRLISGITSVDGIIVGGLH